MKKLLLTLIVSIAFCGSIFAQDGIWNPLELTSNWSDFDYHAFMDQKGFVAAIQIDGVTITVEDFEYDYFESLEVAAFVGEGDAEECRGNLMFLYPGYVEDYGDPYPTIDGCAIYYTTPGDAVHFKMYDHQNNILYTECTVIYDGEPIDVITGEWYDQGWDDPENPVFINFSSPVSASINKLIEGYEEEGGWYLLSSPIGEVSPTNVTNLISGTYDLYSFNQSAELEWINYQASADAINPEFGNLLLGNGYLYANQEGTELQFWGEAYEGPGTFDLVYNAEASDPNMVGWNLVGNPFNAEANVVGRDYYMMNETRTELMLGEGAAVPAMEGVFVKAEEEGEQVEFTTGAKVEGSLVAVSLISSRGIIDRALVRFGQGRMLPKFQLNRNSTKVYIPVDGEDYAVVRSEGMGEVPVNFKAEKSGNYTLAVSGENVNFNYLHLIDNMTGADVDLLVTPSYSFEASANDYASRFRLVFATGENDETFAFYSNGSWIISNEGNATVQVIDVTGRIMSSETIEGSASIRVDGAAGVYMIRLINGDNIKVQKVVVK